MKKGFSTTVRPVSGLPISVSKRQGTPKSREFITLGGLGFGVEYGVHNSSLSNVLRGLTERVYRVQGKDGLVPPPRPAKGAFDRLSAIRGRLLRAVGSCRPWSREEFISSYRGAKRSKATAAAESLSRRPVCKADARLSTFVKAEKLNLSKKPDPAPRLIQPRSARYNGAVGPYLKSVEHKIYGAIARLWGGPTVMKGYNAVEVAGHLWDMWCAFANPVAVGIDASRFDQHVSVDALRWEHSVYNAIFRCPELKRWLDWQLKNHGMAFTPDGIVAYTVDGCRASGDINTALGNCLIMCALVLLYCIERKIKARLANNGDDCVVIMSRRHLPAFSRWLREWFLEFGFNMTVEAPVYEFERIDFCQTRPVYAHGRWVMCRDPRIVLDKDTTNLHPHNVPYASWLAHVGEGGGALAKGVPVLQMFYQVLRALGNDKPKSWETTGMDYMTRGLKCEVVKITDEARISFYKAYGITPWDQLALEAELARRGAGITMGLKSDGLPISHPLLNIEDGW